MTECAQCKDKILCTPEGSCWCKGLPHLITPKDKVGCLCQQCLIIKMAALINEDQVLTNQEKSKIAQLGLAASPQEGVDYYMHNKLLVMTRWYHLRRGYCCNNSCKHCPY